MPFRGKIKRVKKAIVLLNFQASVKLVFYSRDCLALQMGSQSIPGALAGPSGSDDAATLEQAGFVVGKLMGHTMLENLYTPTAVLDFC